MWCRVITFCVLVCAVLFLVLSCIHGRPVLQLFFHRCCEDNIENDQVIFENFGNNFLRERLVGDDNLVADNDSFIASEEVDEVIAVMRTKLNVHDSKSRVLIFREIFANNNDKGASDNEKGTTVNETNSGSIEVTTMRIKVKENDTKAVNDEVTDEEFEDEGRFPVDKYSSESEEITTESLKVTESVINSDLSRSDEVTTMRIEVNNKSDMNDNRVTASILIEVSDSHEINYLPTTGESELISIDNHVLDELDSNGSVEATTKRSEGKMAMQFKNIDIIK